MRLEPVAELGGRDHDRTMTGGTPRRHGHRDEFRPRRTRLPRADTYRGFGFTEQDGTRRYLGTSHSYLRQPTECMREWGVHARSFRPMATVGDGPLVGSTRAAGRAPQPSASGVAESYLAQGIHAVRSAPKVRRAAKQSRPDRFGRPRKKGVRAAISGRPVLISAQFGEGRKEFDRYSRRPAAHTIPWGPCSPELPGVAARGGSGWPAPRAARSGGGGRGRAGGAVTEWKPGSRPDRVRAASGVRRGYFARRERRTYCMMPPWR